MKTEFKSPFESCDSEHHGRECEIIGTYTHETSESPGWLALPQFKIKFTDTGEIYTAYCDEVDQSVWTPLMKACLLGQVAYDRFFCIEENIVNPFTLRDLASAFDDGVKCMEIKMDGSTKKGKENLFKWALPELNSSSIEKEVG